MFGTILLIAGITFLVAGVGCLCFAKTRICGVCLLICGVPVWCFLGPARDVAWNSTLDLSDCTPLTAAAYADHRKEARKLLAEGADANEMDEEGATPLLKARTGEMARLLIEAGADVELAGGNMGSGYYRGETPLQNAALWSRADVVEVLLAAGAKADAKSLVYGADGGPGDAAARVVRLLLAAGVDVNATYYGTTALHYGYGSPEVREVLLAAGAQVDARDGNGRTPLMYAAWWGRVEAMERLLAAGADVHAVDNEGKSVLDYAKDYALHDWDKFTPEIRPAVVEGVIQRALKAQKR